MVPGRARGGADVKKIPSLYLRDFSPGGDSSRVTREPNPEAAWVLAGEGVATVKRDGTACMLRDGRLFKRYDAKRGKTPPAGFEPCGEPDPKTGHHPGWLPVTDGPEDRWLREALVNLSKRYDGGEDGTYEAVGPKIQGNPEEWPEHMLIRHGSERIIGAPTGFDELADFFRRKAEISGAIEGIVWHHPDGRMAKIKAADFGVPWAGKKVRT